MQRVFERAQRTRGGSVEIEDVGGLLDVQLARLAVRTESVVVEDAVSEIAWLLHLKKDDALTDRVQRAGREVEDVARLHLDALGVKLTVLSQDQADYIGVPVEGPYKPDSYRY